jgi:hypothetical protein
MSTGKKIMHTQWYYGHNYEATLYLDYHIAHILTVDEIVDIDNFGKLL